MSAGKRMTSLWTKRVNLWLYWDIFRSALMHVDESRELVERVDNATLFKESCVKYINKKEIVKEGANKQVISSQADSLIKISRIWADFFPANTSNQPI